MAKDVHRYGELKRAIHGMSD
nr:hypothetical protein [Pseudomonas syringae]